MADYAIFETDEFDKAVAGLPENRRESVRGKLVNFVYPQLRIEPHFGRNIKKLRDYSPETWRYRIGDYRVFYIIDEGDHLAVMLTVSDRKDAYNAWERVVKV